ncbi:hypothetical protein NHJ6243_004831 [Beauveria neobassiana]
MTSASDGPMPVPLAGQVINVILSLAATNVLTHFMTQRLLVIKVWRRLPFVAWLVFAIYIDSYCFVFATAMLQHAFGVNRNVIICRGAILLCLVCYVTTKFIYLFLVEKAYVVRGAVKRRLRSKLYIFNSFGMLGVYVVVVILNFIFRIARMENGQCIIGMQEISMIPLISFDAVVNVYLTILFLRPLMNLHSYKSMPQTNVNARLRAVTFRTFVGSCCTLVSSIVYDITKPRKIQKLTRLSNLSVLMALRGEPAWICLMCCNCDILFSAIVIQWVTSNDNAGTSISSSLGVCHGHGNDGFHGRPAVALRDQNRACHNFSPYLLGAASTSPPTPVEFPLKTTTHCCSEGVEYDAESCDSLSMTAAKMLAAEKKRSVVLVTTTIERDVTAIGSLQPPPSNQPLGSDRSSYADIEVATTAAATLDEAERGIKDIVPWTAYSLRGRSSS